MNPKLAIFLQFHEADKPQAMRLARLIADAEPAKRDDVLFIFARRFDTTQDLDALEYVAQKFAVGTFRTTTPWTGWPGGCNAMARDVINYVQQNHDSAPSFGGTWSEVRGVLLIEPDCVPVRRDWIDCITKEWDSVCDDTPNDAWIMGAWRPSGGEHGHINGNCVIIPNFAPKINYCITQHLAWDCEIAPYVRNNWHDCHTIKNEFDSRNATNTDLLAAQLSGAALVHGYKDESMFNLAKEAMGV